MTLKPLSLNQNLVKNLLNKPSRTNRMQSTNKAKVTNHNRCKIIRLLHFDHLGLEGHGFHKIKNDYKISPSSTFFHGFCLCFSLIFYILCKWRWEKTKESVGGGKDFSVFARLCMYILLWVRKSAELFSLLGCKVCIKVRWTGLCQFLSWRSVHHIFSSVASNLH